MLKRTVTIFRFLAPVYVMRAGLQNISFDFVSDPLEAAKDFLFVVGYALK